MKNPLARFRQAGSFIAGLLIGVSIMMPMFAMMLTNADDWQMLWVFGTLVVLALGLKLQAVITIKARHRRVVKLRRHLAEHRVRGAWSATRQLLRESRKNDRHVMTGKPLDMFQET